MRNLQHVQRKDIETITRLLQDFRCEGCANNNKSAKDKVAGEKQEHQHQQQTQDQQTGQGQVRLTLPHTERHIQTSHPILRAIIPMVGTAWERTTHTFGP